MNFVQAANVRSAAPYCTTGRVDLSRDMLPAASYPVCGRTRRESDRSADWGKADPSPGPVENHRSNRYRSGMPSRLREEIKQTRPFRSAEQEAFLNLQRTA